ncbi:MAG: class I SAM-dependent methyltransferase [Actinomycetota bacterium]|nr:class I SAM-dependent methyltransferase [Actinomycetota bacterium]
MRHYGPSGRGYQSVAPSNSDERRARYEGQHSRLEYFVDEFTDLLGYANGDVFLDLGCGTGQNIRMLAARFPASRIIGYDLNADAVSLVRECEEHPGVSVALGDIADPAFRGVALAEPVDHIIMSHVFSLVFGPSMEETIALRQGIIDDLVASCGKSVVILDSVGQPGPPVITIEQRQRATITDDVMGYFAHHTSGRALMAQSDRTRAVIFSKRRDLQSGGQQ